MAKASRLSRGEKILLLATILFIVIVGVIVYWWQELNAMPVVNIPTPVMPSPNAYDNYARACSMVKSEPTMGIDPSTALFNILDHHVIDGPRPQLGPITGPVPGMPGGPSVKGPTPLTDPTKFITSSEIRTLMALNAPAIVQLRKGFQYDYGRANTQKVEFLARARNLARTVSFASHAAVMQNDWNGATGYAIDNIQFGGEIQHNTSMLGLLVGVALQAIGRGDVWMPIDHLTAAQAKAAARRMEHVVNREAPFSDVLQREEWLTQANLMAMFQRPKWRSELIGASSGESTLVELRFALVSKRGVMDDYTRYMNGLIARAKQPYAAKMPVPTVPPGSLCQWLMPVFDKAGIKKEISATQNALLEVTLALKAYRLEHGKYPASLKALTPGYLQTIPQDPFALNGSLGYRVQGDSAVLYSIGPDGVNNGGTPSLDGHRQLRNAKRTPNSFLTESSTGDIVAGVNVQ